MTPDDRSEPAAPAAPGEPPSLEYLQGWASTAGGGVLDDLVHDLASQIGSSVNNDGPEAQVAFIVAQLGLGAADREIRRLLS